MNGGTDVSGLLREVLRRVQPSEEENREALKFVEGLTEELNRRLSEEGIEGVAQVHGSVARGTWLRGDRDLDIFIVLKRTYTRAVLPRVLDVVKALVGPGWVEAYAEHPYIQAEMGGFQVDFVPCFKMDAAGKPLSATDRTPLHTAFVRAHLKGGMKEEVLLLKQFMHGIGCYGAEVKVGGFSGYLCELLITHFGSFLNALRAARSWVTGTLLDVVGHYRGREGECRKLFRDPLIVVDPVDERRNVASAVTESKLWLFTAASREFLREPHLRFFFPPETKPYDEEALRRTLRDRGSDIVFLILRVGERYVPDVLWGQLYRAERALRGLLEEQEFKVIRTAVWSDEEFNHIVLFEVEKGILPRARLHMGPPVEMEGMSERFLRRHLESERTISGPWIEGSRWWVEVERTYTDAGMLLEDKLQEEGGISIGVPRGIAENLRGFSALMNEE
ncbi:MAG: CCA tRNA nucleotidyltransferase, partial [Candidatus Bathyarchaeia archaeon]